MTEVLIVIWAAMNSPIGITVVAGIALWGLNKLYSFKPAWAKFEGTIIAGIKYAEKAIPDDTPNKPMAKLDAALRYVLTIHREVENRAAKPKEVAALREGLQIMHAALEAESGLKNSPMFILQNDVPEEEVGILSAPSSGTPSAQPQETTPVQRIAKPGSPKFGAVLILCALLLIGGCQAIVVSPGAGPVSIGATNSAVATDGQNTDNAQNAPVPAKEAGGNVVAD